MHTPSPFELAGHQNPEVKITHDASRLSSSAPDILVPFSEGDPKRIKSAKKLNLAEATEGQIINLKEQFEREQVTNGNRQLDDGLGDGLNDACVSGTVTPEWLELLARPMTFLVPENRNRNAKQAVWRNSTAPLRVWIEGDEKDSTSGFSRHIVKAKKGYFPITFGKSASDARKALSMVTADAMALDVDSGDSLAAALDRCEELGLAVIGYTSFNNGTTVSTAPRDAVRKALGHTDSVTDEELRGYLTGTEKYTAEHVASVAITDQAQHEEGGLQIAYSHAPLEKFRLVFPLAAPVEVAKLASTQRVSLDVYAAKVRGLGELIGVIFDQSCIDASRAFYMPAHRKAADYALDIVRGRGLTFEELPEIGKGDAKNAFEIAGGNSGPAVETSSGLNLKRWAATCGKRLEIARLVEFEAPDKVRESKGGLLVIECPFDETHSNAGDSEDSACHVRDADGDVGFAWKCKHNSCARHDRLDMLAKALADGWFEEAKLTDEDYLVPLPEGENDEVIEAFVDVSPLTTPDKVEAAVKRYGELDDDIRAALCAGVILGKNKEKAKAKLDDLLGGTKREREKHWKAGEAYLVAAKSLRALKANEPSEGFKVSLEVSDPLGDTEPRKMESLDARFKIVNYRGKILVIRTIDLEALKAGDQVLEFWTKDSLKSFYSHESCTEKQGAEVRMVNPIDIWWSIAQRYSRVVFDPSDTPARNSINLYDVAKRTLTPSKGDATPITNFIRDIIASGDEVVYDFVILWLAHLVQRPWERPGTALVLYGDGGAGKGTFSHLVRRLVEPYDVGVSRPDHLVGQFSGPSLATSLVVASEEAVYAGDPAMADILKGMITQKSMMVEAKQVQAIQMDVFYRLIIESNHKATVRIEGNNAERRYLVSHVSGAMIGKAEEFEKLYAHIDGPAMQAFMYDLERYDPADAGGWRAVRTAPETVYRKQMFVDSMRRSDKEVLRMLEDGTFIWKDEQQTFRIDLNGDTENRIPAKALDDFVKLHATRFESELRPAAEVWNRLFGEPLEKPRAARTSGERRVLEENEDTSTEKRNDGYVWRKMDFNTSMYHLPGRSTMLAMIKARTGLGDGDECSEAA